MPRSDDGDYDEQVDEPEKTEETKKDKKGKKASKSKKEEKKEEVHDEEKPAEEKKKDTHADDDDDLRQSGGVETYGNESAAQYSKTLHMLMLIMLSTTLICLLAIIPSRSLGTAQDFSCGAWEACYGDNCYTELGCGTASNQTAAGVFGIIAIIHAFVMLVLQVLEFQTPGRFGAFAKIQAVLNHLLWLWVLVSWACWASVHDAYHDNCSDGITGLNHFYYAWGFVFLVGMWLTHFFLAIILTLKAAGKKVCGL